MQDLLGLGDTRRVKALAGLAGGVGHKGAACGILTGGASALAVFSAQSDEEQAALTARASMCVNQYVRWFVREAGSALCRDIIHTDFDDDRQVRRYILTKSRTCVRLASKAAATMVDMISEGAREPDNKFYELNRGFHEQDFHCAYSTLNRTSELLEINQMLGPNLLIPLNGGIGYSGATCSALLGGCIAIGLVRGGDTSQMGMASAIKRIALTILFGGATFSRLDLSPANDALLRCGQLVSWFQTRFGSNECRSLIGFEFTAREKAAGFFAGDIERCKKLSDETAAKAAELAK